MTAEALGVDIYIPVPFASAGVPVNNFSTPPTLLSAARNGTAFTPSSTTVSANGAVAQSYGYVLQGSETTLQGAGLYTLVFQCLDASSDYPTLMVELDIGQAWVTGISTLLSRLTALRATALDFIDASILSRSSHSASDVWSVGTRTLTSFGTLIADIWANVSRTLSSTSDSAGVTTLLSRLSEAINFTSGRVNAQVAGMEDDSLSASALSAAAVAEIQSGLATASSLATAIATLAKIDGMVVLDGAVYQYTANALELAPSAMASGVADAVLDELLSGHTISGSTGEALAAIRAKTDLVTVRAVRYESVYDTRTRTLTIVRGNTPTILIENLTGTWTGATDITLGIRLAGQENTEPLIEIAGVVVSATALSVTFPINFGISPELDSGEGIYEWDLTGELTSGEIRTAVMRSPLTIIDRIARL